MEKSAAEPVGNAPGLVPAHAVPANAPRRRQTAFKPCRRVVRPRSSAAVSAWRRQVMPQQPPNEEMSLRQDMLVSQVVGATTVKKPAAVIQNKGHR